MTWGKALVGWTRDAAHALRVLIDLNNRYALDGRDPASYLALREAVVSRSEAERSIKDAVAAARSHGYSWAFIGKVIGTSGEAARQRYGHKQDA